MTKLALFKALCEVADALQQESVRTDFSPHTLALEAICERIDVLIAQVLGDGVQEDRGVRSLAYWRTRDRDQQEPPHA